MTAELLMKGSFALLFSGLFAWMVFDRDAGSHAESSRQRYLPYIPGLLLPACLLALTGCAFLVMDPEDAVRLTLSFCVGVFLQICLYYLLLVPALPFLRRHISARACAVLWMLPNYLYLTQMSYMRLPRPLWVIEAPAAWIPAVLAVWTAGFAAVLGYAVVSHLAFRAQLLRGACPVTDPAVLAVWQQEVEAAQFRKPQFRLMVSPGVQTPLSVGLFSRSVRVVLPQRSYTPDELALIFRHELVHIGREDPWNKFFLVFCLAMCWFDPLMWVAVKKCSEDLELSCDETVLLGQDEAAKRQYAGLLLKTAGNERGFTTCLSASASALRHRLKSVVAPQKKPSGALVVGLVFFLLCMSSGYVGLALGETSGAEAIYRSGAPEQFALRNERLHNFVCTDEAALHRYLSALRMEPVSGNYSFDADETSLFLLFDTPDGPLGITLFDRFLRLVRVYGKTGAEYYYLPDGADWDALRACIFQYPVLQVRLSDEHTAGTFGASGTAGAPGQTFTASLWRISLVEGTHTEVLFEAGPDETPAGVLGYPACQAALSFEFPRNGNCEPFPSGNGALPVDGSFEAEIVPLNGTSSCTIALDGQAPTVSVPAEACRCTVRGYFPARDGDGKQYCIEYRFELGDL